MLLCLTNVLTAAQLAQVHELLKGQEFQDGRATAGWSAKLVKNNQQLSSSTPHQLKLQQIIVQALKAHAVFTLAAMPKTFRPIMFSRYNVGMSYGDHVDNALMGDEPQVRSDLSFTIFLNEPGDYDGGNLIIDAASGTQGIKLPAGAIVLYPSGYLHRVEPVTRGSRLVAVGWLQSLIRRVDQREILFELETLRRQMFLADGKNAAFDALSKNVANLWRMWAEP
jgi:PKHD-type hydroxylase